MELLPRDILEVHLLAIKHMERLLDSSKHMERVLHSKDMEAHLLANKHMERLLVSSKRMEHVLHSSKEDMDSSKDMVLHHKGRLILKSRNGSMQWTRIGVVRLMRRNFKKLW